MNAELISVRLSKDCGFDPHQELSFFLAYLPSSPVAARVAKAGETYAPGGAHLGQGREEKGAENRQRERHRGRDRQPRALPELEKWNGKSHCIFDPGVLK